MYNKINRTTITFVVLYVDDILLTRHDIYMLSIVKVWLSNNFSMKDLGEATYV